MSDKGYLLKEDDLLPLSIGAALLGTGGGGNPYVGMLRARELIRQGAQVRVLPLDALPDDAWIGECGGIGAPVVGIEKIEEGRECYRAIRAVEEVAGVKMSALISAEIGGANSLEPVIAAAYAGLSSEVSLFVHRLRSYYDPSCLADDHRTYLQAAMRHGESAVHDHLDESTQTMIAGGHR